MKRNLKLTVGDGHTAIYVEAKINTNGSHLTADEVERLRGELADRLMPALIGLPYTKYRLSEIEVG